jgi:hypothetical protein
MKLNKGAGYSQGLRGADGKDRGGESEIAECRIGYRVQMSKVSGAAQRKLRVVGLSETIYPISFFKSKPILLSNHCTRHKRVSAYLPKLTLNVGVLQLLQLT